MLLTRPYTRIHSFLLFSLLFLTHFLNAQKASNFPQHRIDSVLRSGSGVSGAGKRVTGNGWGGWRSGSAGVMYMGSDPKPEWQPMRKDQVSASAIRNGLLPPIKPIWDAHPTMHH